MKECTSQRTVRSKWILRIQAVLALMLGVAGLFSTTACAFWGPGGKVDTTIPLHGEGFSYTITEKTPLNEIGTNQTQPPKCYLDAGERVLILAQAGDDYFYVQTWNTGAKGYVPKSVVRKHELMR